MTDRLPDSLVILLHGVAAFGYDLDPLAGMLRRSLPRTAVVAPDAPFAYEQGPGRQWYSLEGVTPENRLARIVAARPAFDALIRSLVAAQGLEKRLERVALVGFSQGATLAFDAVARGRWPVGALALLSGRFVAPAPFTPARMTPVLLVHGSADGAVPSEETRRARALLQEADMTVESHILRGVGHTISPTGVKLTRRFLRERLGEAGV
ncbi:prolyl oligopeptidase family serine peptidase [Labrys sp. KNU-23]|uniref:alpha/beta hydrolase n=1 Tax=Labrys sp. KNU-23 TaxID=2789216 RepID=UPI0011F07F9F|nr:dienelactone hydrolase family protein [Labrys sp. KNU-23]QEN88082.1 prolyl oligopeptidase family serine peptidase [Labrys sp. KNU-23]